MEKILCAAIWIKSGPLMDNPPSNIDAGYILGGYTHQDILQVITQITSIPVGMEQIEYGFLTNSNKFVDRKEGMDIFRKYENKEFKGRSTLMSHDLHIS